MEDAGRDPSHGIEHFERVRELSIKLADKETVLTDEQSLLLQLGALCHDVLDHKYIISEEHYGSMKRDLQEALKDVACLQDQQMEDVLLLAENISLSREEKGNLQEKELTDRRLLDLRNFISDADKLDALGRQGLERLVQYQLAHIDIGQLTPEYLRGMAHKHLLKRFFYLRTTSGFSLGKELYEEMEDILSSDERLMSILQEMITQKSTSCTS